MQSAFMGSLLEITEKDPSVLYLTADSGEGGLDRFFQMNFPDRTFDFGIAEMNLVGAAAGLAAAGKIPFVYTAAPFLAYRAFEFIRNDVCLQNLNVKIIGSGSGLSVSSLGPTHHTTEDISVLRALPNLMLLSPATPIQAAACMRKAYEHKGPVYIRLGLNKEKEFFAKDYELPEGGADILREGSDVTVFSTGSILSEVMAAAELLAAEGIEAEVINIPVLKPFNGKILTQAKGRYFVSVEEHNIHGGLGSILAEELSMTGEGIRLKRIGLEDCFSCGYGKIDQLRKENGLDAEAICRKIRDFICADA